jgi:hypothetical protein
VTPLSDFPAIHGPFLTDYRRELDPVPFILHPQASNNKP